MAEGKNDTQREIVIQRKEMVQREKVAESEVNESAPVRLDRRAYRRLALSAPRRKWWRPSNRRGNDSGKGRRLRTTRRGQGKVWKSVKRDDYRQEVAMLAKDIFMPFAAVPSWIHPERLRR